MRHFSAFLLLLVICISGAAAAGNPPSLIPALLDATVALADPEDGAVSCAGVWISKTQVLTAAHCTEQDKHEYFYFGRAEAVEVDEAPTDMHPLHLVKRNEGFDLALLETEGEVPRHAVAPLAATETAIGETVHIVGHPRGMIWSYVRGLLAAKRGDYLEGPGVTKGPWLQLSAPIWPGNSGGGAFNDKGELIGITSWMTRAYCMGFAVPASTIRNFLK